MSQQTRKSMPYGLDYQKAIIRLMMIDPVFCGKAIDQLKRTDFTGETSWFYGVIKDAYKGHCPTKEFLSAEITKHSADKHVTYYLMLDEICAIKPDPVDISNRMTGFIRANIFIDSCKEAVSLYNGERHDKAYALVTERMEKLNRVNFGTDGNTRFDETPLELALKSLDERNNAIPLGIHAIDDALGGGLLPGTWTTFLAPTNAGKSMLMPNIAKQAALRKKRAFITIHEDEEIPTKLRYLSCFSGIPYAKIAYAYSTLDPVELQAVQNAHLLLKEYVVIRFMYTAEATVEKVMDQARILMRDWNPTPDHPTHGYDLYLCDYGQCLTSHASKKSDSPRHEQEHIYHMLKQLCLELNIPGAGGAQVNREANKKGTAGYDYLRVTDVAEAFGIIKKSSNVITINRSADDTQKNRIVFLLDKCRNGRVGVAVECNSDYAKAMVYNTDVNTQTDVSGEISHGPAKREENPPKGSGEGRKMHAYG